MNMRLLSEGMTVRSAAGVLYEDVRYLSEGVTSEVYRARRAHDQAEVALKVLRPDLTPLLTEAFWSECGTLGSLTLAEERLQDGIRAVPRLLERDEGNPAFIAMELAPGESLERLLEPAVHLSEQDALLVAERILRVMQLLHEEVRRTYDDLQLKNIFLDRLQTTGSRKVTLIDWNTLGPKAPDGEPLPPSFGGRDLARVGAYLYRMLTGKGADERGEPEAALIERAGERWEDISRGTRQIVFRSLHPNRAHRFITAHEFRAAILDQQRLHVSHPVDLLGLISDGFSQDLTSPDTLERLLTLLDMGHRVGVTEEQAAYYERQLVEHVGHVSIDWEAGHRYFSAEQYRSAVEKWEREAEAQGRVTLWRYVLLAQAGVELGASHFAEVRDIVRQAIQLMEEGQGAQGHQLLDERVPVECCKSSPSLRALAAEAQVHCLLEEAENLEMADNAVAFTDVAKRVREAASYLRQVPYGVLLAAERGWEGLEERAERWVDRARDRQELDHLSAELLRETANFATARDRFALALRRDNRHRGVVNAGMDTACRLREKGRAQDALELLELCLLFGHVPEYQDRLRTEWHATLEVARHGRAIDDVRSQHEEALAALRLQQEREVNNERRRHAKALETCRAEHRQKEVDLRDKHNAEMRAFRRHVEDEANKHEERYTQALNAKEAELRRAYETDLQQLDMNLRFEHARGLLKAGQWSDFLDFVPQLSIDILYDHRRWGDLVEQLSKQFDYAMDHQVGALARPLLDILAVMEPGRAKERGRKYDTMVARLKDEMRGLDVKIRATIQARGSLAVTPSERLAFLHTLEFLVEQVDRTQAPGLYSFAVATRDRLASEVAIELAAIPPGVPDVEASTMTPSSRNTDCCSDTSPVLPAAGSTETVKVQLGGAQVYDALLRSELSGSTDEFAATPEDGSQTASSPRGSHGASRSLGAIQ